jgi:transposase-like protein
LAVPISCDDQSGANLAALKAINVEHEPTIRIRQRKYLNNIVEQDHQSIKCRIRPMLGFKKFSCARILLTGIHKGQMKHNKLGRTPAQFFHSLAA